MPARTVVEIEIRIPPGPNGELGFAIGMAGQNIIPFNSNEWIVTSDEVIRWQFETPLNSGAWQCQSYNTGTYDHTIQVRFYVNLVTVAGAVPGASVLSVDDIIAADATQTAVSIGS